VHGEKHDIRPEGCAVRVVVGAECRKLWRNSMTKLSERQAKTSLLGLVVFCCLGSSHALPQVGALTQKASVHDLPQPIYKSLVADFNEGCKPESPERLPQFIKSVQVRRASLSKVGEGQRDWIVHIEDSCYVGSAGNPPYKIYRFISGDDGTQNQQKFQYGSGMGRDIEGRGAWTKSGMDHPRS
jgi:hypothetical protein